MEKREQAYQYFLQGISYKEIAEKCDIPFNQVKYWVYKYWKNNNNEVQKRGAPEGNKNAVANKGGAPKGNKNNYKHGIYEKLLFEFLSEDEKKLFLKQDIDEEKECKMMVRFCDLQIFKFMKKIKELEQKKEVPHDLILRYNGEIEKAKKQKIKCIEMLFAMKETETKKGYGIAYDGFMEALKQGAKEVWSDNHDTE